MFTKTIIKEVKVVDEVKIKELQNKIDNLETEKKQLRIDIESEKRILKNELHVEVSKAVEQKEKESTTIREENAVLKKEVEILTKAFENMGFDVKDMKEILNKLVDGIVSKNEINIVK